MQQDQTDNFLSQNDFIIHTANDGEEGLSLFFELHPDVLVADVMMPKMDGFEMVRRIRQTDKQTPVLFLTARSAINDVVEGFLLMILWVYKVMVKVLPLSGSLFTVIVPPCFSTILLKKMILSFIRRMTVRKD